MKEKEILAFIKEYMPQAMALVRKSRENRHLMYVDDLFNQYNSLESLRAVVGDAAIPTLNVGYTSSNCFALKEKEEKWGQIVYFTDLYELKKEYTPSQGLDDILNNGITLIDCVQSVNIAWYLCIRELLIKCYQKEDGTKKFNELFTFGNHPFIISGYDTYGRTGNAFGFSDLAPVPILAFFIDDNEADNKYPTAASDPRVKPGVRIIIYNNHDYINKHAIGSDGAWNAVCVGKDQYMVFDDFSKTLSEQEIKQELKKRYDAQYIVEKKPHLKYFDLIKRLKLAQQAKDYPSIKIPPAGYCSLFTKGLDVSKLVLLTEDFPKALRQLKVFVPEYQVTQMLSFKRYFTNDGYNTNHRNNIAVLKLAIEKMGEALVLQHEVGADAQEIEKMREVLICTKKDLADLYQTYQQHLEAVTEFQAVIRESKKTNNPAFEQMQLDCKGKISQIIAKLNPSDTETLAISIKPSLQPPQITSACVDILCEVTCETFKFSEKSQVFWMTHPNTEYAAEIVRKIKGDRRGFAVTGPSKVAKQDKDAPDMYRITVAPFTPDSAVIVRKFA
jgi:hypothetical protein